MERLDGARRIGGLCWVALGLGFQVLWAVRNGSVPGPVSLLLIGTVLVLAAVTVLPAPTSITWAVAVTTSVLLGVDFAGAVADRFGAFGAAGQAGVSWGSWAAFVDYTALLLPGAPGVVVVTAALLATVAEVALSLLLISGLAHRWVGKAAAGLLVIYLAVMTFSVGLDAVATYAVPVLIGGALLVSARSSRASSPPPTAVPTAR